MTRTCYDSTNALDLPRKAEMALAYTDGLYGTDKTASPKAVKTRCPDALIVTVTVLGRGPWNMVDCEPGDTKPSSATAWSAQQLDGDGRPRTIYFPISWHDQVVAECKRQGLKVGRDVLLFGAHYDGQAKIPAGYVGIQYEDPTLSHHHYDVSVVADYWPGVDPRPRLARLKHGKRRTARQLRRELDRRINPIGPEDRALLKRTQASIRRVLNLGKKP